ncbi:hypothetical protein A9G00_40275 [Achromobacter xylosoxidans]|nr:hypothetical protein A7P23_23025 [Achromobacter xylosoxidans]ODA19307.1 hypothetical protein A9G00_40275 [Achromobacter xylosoxidans]
MWEPHPWDLDDAAADIQRQGFHVRGRVAVGWQSIPFGDLPAEGLFGLTADQLRSAEAVCHSTVQDEHWVLTQRLWHGFPDPPEWGLWTRRRDAAGQPWTSWGQFAALPPAWRLPPGVD